MEPEPSKPTRIGPLLRQVLDKQKELIKEATYDCVKTSDVEAGEVIAKKAKAFDPQLK